MLEESASLVLEEGSWDIEVELWLHSFHYFLGSGQRKQEVHQPCESSVVVAEVVKVVDRERKQEKTNR